MSRRRRPRGRPSSGSRRGKIRPLHRCVDCGAEIPSPPNTYDRRRTERQDAFVLVIDGDAGGELLAAVILETEDPTGIPARAEPEGKRAKSEA